MSDRWTNPLTIAIVAAALAGFSNAYIAFANNEAQLELETKRAESERILEVLKGGDPNRVRENLRFLLQLGLVQDEGLKARIEAWQANPSRAPAYLWRDRVAGAEGAQAGPPSQDDEAGRPAPADPSGY